MCNIKNLPCNSCGRKVETHIGDYSIDPDSITIFCHHCKENALEFLTGFNKESIIFSDSGCLFIMDLPHSIHLNGTRKDCVGRLPKIRKNTA